MAVKVATHDMLLESLLENPHVKAAVIVDDRGYVIVKRGVALSLKAISDDETVALADPTKKKSGPSENLYLVQAGADYLIVVFNDRLNFERLKASVDETLAQFDMAPAPDDDEQ